MKKSKLTLNKEVISSLNSDQMKGVEGGYSHPTTCGEYESCQNECEQNSADGNCNTVEDCFQTVAQTCDPAGCADTDGCGATVEPC